MAIDPKLLRLNSSYSRAELGEFLAMKKSLAPEKDSILTVTG